jgi:hypothetical protein
MYYIHMIQDEFYYYVITTDLFDLMFVSFDDMITPVCELFYWGYS